MKKFLVLTATVAALLGFTACSSDSGSSDAPTATVRVENMSYSPASVTVKKGDTVEWIFDDNGLPHDVVESSDETFKSELLTEGSYSYTFEEAGTFDYHCTPHPMMLGTVIVEE
ncbi:cupredoxin family copper-binding protein [Rhodococcus sp. G-MC3]|uniref:cupredoxin domain-containing protein n=1 Tax=Rhodococcus sp. G-MC3 TaxID=3046209 RepID=UPI0024B9F57B|nr:cupredoxin family copper-binding protein [Rhodococcus sp. G-MC3]MDJ0395108.1 cupredoxin family copper-binding protein [Rhodococcus sp. G-MC3]